MQTVKQFARKHKVKLEVFEIQSRPDKLMSDMPKGSKHWFCVLKHEDELYETFFSQGPAHTKKPTVIDLLDCMASDCSTTDYCDDALDLFQEFGYKDPNEARLVWNAIARQREGMERLLGKDVLEELMYETERE